MMMHFPMRELHSAGPVSPTTTSVRCAGSGKTRMSSQHPCRAPTSDPRPVVHLRLRATCVIGLPSLKDDHTAREAPVQKGRIWKSTDIRNFCTKGTNIHGCTYDHNYLTVGQLKQVECELQTYEHGSNASCPFQPMKFAAPLPKA